MAASSSNVIRKTLGTLRDASKVGLAKVQSEYQDLDIAVVKATNHVECPPKEKHVRTIFAASSQARPRADVAYLISALAKRLQKTHNWTVALKTLVVIHRTLREGDPTFREELLNYTRSRGQLLNLSNFKDDSSPEAWDYSAWTRTYALYLEERLESFRVLKYDVESEKSMGHSRTRELDTPDLLEHLPSLQQLLYRLMCCQPEGAAVSNFVIGSALGLVLKESFKLYRAINDGIINLVDKFFEMQRHDAVKALEIYKLAGKQGEKLQEFYDCCKQLDLARSFQFPPLEVPPQSFLGTMEEYVKDAPRAPTSSAREEGRERYDERDRDGDRRDTRDTGRERDRERFDDRSRSKSRPPPSSEDYRDYREPVPPHRQGGGGGHVATPPRVPVAASAYHEDNSDLLGLGNSSQDAAQIEDANMFALAIVPGGSTTTNNNFSPDSPNNGPSSGGGGMNAAGSSGWDLALVPSDGSGPGSQKGGFDKLVLDSLYDDALTKRQTQQSGMGVAPRPGMNPFESAPAVQSGQDPFAASAKFPAPPTVQMAAMAQQQAMMHRGMGMPGAGGFGMPMGPQAMGANPFMNQMGYQQGGSSPYNNAYPGAGNPFGNPSGLP